MKINIIITVHENLLKSECRTLEKSPGIPTNKIIYTKGEGST